MHRPWARHRPQARAVESPAVSASGENRQDLPERALDLAERLAAAPDAEARAHLLSPLPPAVRAIALAVSGVLLDPPGRTSHARRALGEIVLAERSLLRRAASGELRDFRLLQSIWREIRSDSTRAMPGALVLAVAGRLPLSVVQASHVLTAADRDVRALLGMATGRAARASFDGAARVLRDLLRPDVESEVVRAALAGIGDGLIEAGFSWLTWAARTELRDRLAWSDAAETGAVEALAMGSGASAELSAIALASAQTPEVARRRVRGLGAEPQGRADLLALWTRWPASVRAALLSGLSPSDPDVRDAWLADASSAVVAAGISALTQEPAAQPLHPAIARRLVGLLAHPEPATQRQAATILAARSQKARAPRPVPSPRSAQVVTLPPSVFARTELDRLRIAIWTADAELIGDIASKLTPQEREPARRALIAACFVPDMALRRAAIEAIASMGDVRDAAALIDIARRFRTLEGPVTAALRQLGARDQVDALATLFCRRLKWADDQATDDFVEIAGEERVSHLLAALDTRFFPAARAGAARAIARTRTEEGVFALRKHSLSDPHRDARQAAVRALRTMGCTLPPPEEVAGYALLFEPIDNLVDASAAAQRAGSAALAGLKQTLRHGSWKRRRAACGVLAGVGTSGARDTLLDALLDVDEDVRLAAREALARQGWKPRTPREHTLAAVAKRQTIKLLRTPEALDVEALEESLTLGGHVFRNEIVDTLERVAGWKARPAIRASVAATRLDAVRALEEPDGLRVLLRALDCTWQSVPHRSWLSQGLRAVPAAELEAIRAAEDLGWRSREAIAKALGRFGDDDAARALGILMTDPDDDVRKVAHQSLARVGTEAAARALVVGLSSPFREDRKPVAEALAAIGEPALPVLRELVEAPWWEERRAAAAALKVWTGDLQIAADLLIELAIDPEHRVSQLAREVLAQIGLRPRGVASARAVAKAQTTAVEGLQPWLGLDVTKADPPPDVLEALRTILADGDPDELVHRVGMVASLRAFELRPVVERLASGGTDHLGLKLAAAETMRRLATLGCVVCEGLGFVRCPACDGGGELACERCGGAAVLNVVCPETDCNATATTRAIDSRPCATCRGRGVVPQPCHCNEGQVVCDLCHGSARIRCLVCDGTGEVTRA